MGVAKTNKFDFMIIFFMLLVFSMTWGNISGFNILTHNNPYLFMVCVVLLTLRHVRDMKMHSVDFWVMFVSLPIALFNMLFNHSRFGSLVVLALLLLMMISTKYLRLTKPQIDFITVYLFVYSVFWNSLSHGGYNSNSIGLAALLVYLSFTLSVYYRKGLVLNIILWAMFTYVTVKTIGVIVNSGSRGGLYSLFVFILLRFVLPVRIWTTKLVYSLLIGGLTLGSIVFVYIYIYLWEHNITFNVFLSDKHLFTGRQAIWIQLSQAFSGHELTGIGSAYDLTSFFGIFNAHNAMFDILVVYGIPLFFMVVSYMLMNFMQARKIISIDKTSRIAFAAIAAVLFDSFFETTLVFTDNYPVIYLLFAVLFSRVNQMKE